MLRVVPVFERKFVDVMHRDLADTTCGHIKRPEIPHR